MNTQALVLMIFSMVVLWGGLVLAVVHLNRATPDGPTAGPGHLDPDAVRDHTL